MPANKIIDKEAMQKLIAKVKKADADSLASMSSAVAAESSIRSAADEGLQEQINSIGSSYETKADAKAKANSWGVGMRYQATNTLKFFRPNL